MKKKFVKSIASGLISAVMLTTNVSAVIPVSVNAGMCLGESTFEQKGLPWKTCETTPASQNFEVDQKKGVYRITINEPGGEKAGGESRWDLQFRHRKIKIQAGHKYKIHWEVTASTAGEMATQITTLNGEFPVWHNIQDDENDKSFGQSWDNVQISKGKNVFDGSFTSTETIENAEWSFHYGGAGPHQAKDCFPKGTVLEFDNMILECETCGDIYKDGSCLWDPSIDFGIKNRKNSGLENNFISVNQEGYYTNLDKTATLGDNGGGDPDSDIHTTIGSTPMEFTVIDSHGNAAFKGKSKPLSGTDPDSGDNCHILDFSELKTPGLYHIECGEYRSFNFRIDDNIYGNTGHNLLTDAMNYFYQNRSGMNIESSYITSGDKSALAHLAGHKSDKAYVQSKWQDAYAYDFDGDTAYAIDGTGGWYNASDHGKYVVGGGISVWTLQNIFERDLRFNGGARFADGSGTVSIPESKNKIPDILDEAAYELDWMMKMVVGAKDPYWGKYAGLVYHKMQDHKWTGLAVKPNDYESEWGTSRIVKPPSFAATANLAACAAQAARLWKPYNLSKSNEYLETAKKCYEALQRHYYAYGEYSGETDESYNKNPTSLYAPLHHQKAGEAYGDTNVTDEMYWAACELFATTGEMDYYQDLYKYADAFNIAAAIDNGEKSISAGSFNWKNTGTLGSLSLYLNPDRVIPEDYDRIVSSLKSAASKFADLEEKQAYGIPYSQAEFANPISLGDNMIVKGYENHSNSFVLNNAMILAYAYDETADSTYLNGVTAAMDYLLGRNPLSFSYISGYGDYCLKNPNHRYWANEVDSRFPSAPDGVVSGGCSSILNDAYVAGLGYAIEQVAPQRCYVDSCEAWSVNECGNELNASLAWVTSFLQSEASNYEAPSTPTTKPTTNPTTKPVTTTTTAKVTTTKPVTTTTTAKVTTTKPITTTTSAKVTTTKPITTTTTAKVTTTTSVQITTTKPTTSTTSAETTTTLPYSTTSKITTTLPVVTNAFAWDRDNWNFKNSRDYFKRGKYYLRDNYISKMRDSFTNKEWDNAESAIGSRWRGSCYGMSALALLSKYNLLTYGIYTSGANCLNNLESPADNEYVESLVNYYQLLQYKDSILQQYRIVPTRGDKVNIEDIIAKLKVYPEVLIGYQQQNFGGHAVIAYGATKGSWTISGVTYNNRIEILDPNASLEYDEDACIYYNSSGYNWTIPRYEYVNSAHDAVFNCVIAEPEVVNNGGYLNEKGIQMNFTDDYKASLEISKISDNFGVTKVEQNSDGVFMNRGEEDDIIPATFFFLGGESEGKTGRILNDPDSAYKVSQKKVSEMNMKLDYENCLIEANAAAGKEMIFDPSGFAYIKGAGTNYEFRMVFNEGYCPTADWYKINVSGTNADDISIKNALGGYVLTGNNLSDVKVSANNDDVKAECEFSTDYDSAFIYEIDKNTIGVKVDTDGNGTYETDIAEIPQGDVTVTDVPADIEATLYGDSNNDGTINVADVVKLNKYLLNRTDNPLEGVCLANSDCMKDNVIDSSDSTFLMNYVSMQITADMLGKN